MSKIVSKGTNRPAAVARTKKHAQRTPLPPRPGDVAEAKAPIDPPPVKGTPAHREAQIEAGMERKRTRRKAEDSDATKKKSKRPVDIDLDLSPEQSKKVQAYLDKKKAPTKSELKAAPIGELAAELGWSSSIATDEEHTTLVVTRGRESISILWVSGVFQPPCTYTIGDRTIGVRNASEAKQRMAKSPDVAESEAAKVRAAKAIGVGTRSARPKAPRALPFSEASTDAEVLDAVHGRRITWTNSVSGGEEIDSVPTPERVHNRSNRPKLTEGPQGRILTFTGPSGFRSVRLSSIIAVR